MHAVYCGCCSRCSVISVCGGPASLNRTENGAKKTVVDNKKNCQGQRKWAVKH